MASFKPTQPHGEREQTIVCVIKQIKAGSREDGWHAYNWNVQLSELTYNATIIG